MRDKKPYPKRDQETVRASVSFNVGDYEQLERLAAEKKVSLAWVVREAVSLYIQDDPQSAANHANKV